MWLDQTRCDPNIGFDEPPVNSYRRTTRGRSAKVDVISVVACVVVDDGYVFQHPRVTDQFKEVPHPGWDGVNPVRHPARLCQTLELRHRRAARLAAGEINR